MFSKTRLVALEEFIMISHRESFIQIIQYYPLLN